MIAVVLATPAIAQSDAAPRPPMASSDVQAIHLRYEANWSGLHVADFSLSLLKNKEAYENRFHLETRGLTRLLSNLTVRATSRGRIATPSASGLEDTATPSPQAEVYVAEHYRAEYTNRKHFRWVDIAFGQNGEPAKAMTGTSPIPGREDRWNPKDKGPEVLDKVEPEHRVDVADPITMLPQMIALVRTHLMGGAKSGIIKGFDGRRRFDLEITYLGVATRTVSEVKHNTYHVRIHPRPVAGFKERHKVVWEGALYDLYLSRDGRFVPLQIVPLKRGPVITLVAECESESACQVHAEEEG